MSKKNTDSFRAMIHSHLSEYFVKLEDAHASDLYNLFLKEVEAPFFEMIMEQVAHNQSLAAKMLGLSRGTLRKKLAEYELL